MKWGLHFEYARKEALLKEAEQKAADPALWEEGARAQEFMKKMGALREQLRPLQELAARLEEIEVLLSWPAKIRGWQRGAAGSSGRPGRERPAAGPAGVGDPLQRRLRFQRCHRLPASGAGGLESQDWAEMLLRMYTLGRAEGLEVELVDLLRETRPCEERHGSCAGRRAYGYLQAEKGVHRLIRISPFDTARRRHTSFASIDVIPEVEAEDYEINPDDLRIDTFRSSGAGGQHVNKTDSAVRITHLPTGLVVTCQNNRSQHSNRLQAMRILQARLAEMQRREQAEELSALRGFQKEIAWGSQIRTYIFHPFTLVKDHRTGVERGQVEAVMDGALDPFIEAFLRWQARRRSQNNGVSEKEGRP